MKAIASHVDGRHRVTAQLVCWALLLLVFGCRGSVAKSDMSQAEELLKQTLEDWKRGVTVAELRDRETPVYVAEDLWQSGYRLLEFSTIGSGEERGTNVRFAVQLTCESPGGKKRRVRADYVISTTPACTVARLD
ncbi:MAG: hypothetical protein NXI32_13135 [bacterium]|nr:hypothetical protein [bacterium]